MVRMVKTDAISRLKVSKSLEHERLTLAEQRGFNHG